MALWCTMNVQTHFLLPFLIGMILVEFKVLSVEMALLCGIFGVLVDIDHYIEHILHAKSNRFSVLAAWNNAVVYHRFEQRSFIHHMLGFILLTAIFLLVYLFNPVLSIALFVGYYSHMLLDYIPLRKDKFVHLHISRMFFNEPTGEVFLDIILILLTSTFIFI